ncbi:efflux RND transporter periplasmic adaptor subunit [Hyphomonas sp.]
MRGGTEPGGPSHAGEVRDEGIGNHPIVEMDVGKRVSPSPANRLDIGAVAVVVMRRSTSLKIGLSLVLITAGSYGLFAFLRPSPLPEQVIYGNGRIEATEIRSATEIGGRVADDRILEGTTVAKGDLLIALDSTELELQKAIGEARIASARADRRRLEAELATARHHLGSAKSDLDRARELEAKGTATLLSREQAENAFEDAKGNVTALEAGIGASDAHIKATLREVDLIAERITKTRLTAPIDGTVLTKAVEEGEVLQPGQAVAILADLTHVELKIYVPESDLGKVRPGAVGKIAIDAFPDRTFEARVARVDAQAQFTPRDIHMPDERVRTIFGVTLALDNPDGWLKPGMPADAWVLWQPEAEWPDRLFVPQ